MYLIKVFSTSISPYQLFSSFAARGKKHHKHMQILMYGAIGIFGVLGQLFIGKLAIVSAAALMIAKIALVLSLLVRYKLQATLRTSRPFYPAYGDLSQLGSSPVSSSLYYLLFLFFNSQVRNIGCSSFMSYYPGLNYYW